MRNLLLLSSSREGDSGYLEHARSHIEHFLTQTTSANPVKVVFIPFAGVTVSYDDYTQMVSDALNGLPLKITSIHQESNPDQAIRKADAIIVGGGNTFHLLHQLYQFELIGTIREKVMQGTPYIGWSAGSNIAAPGIFTTNDMPIIQPPSFHALHLVPFQINPHYLDQHPPGFNGETREQRIREFMVINPDAVTLGLPEGTAIQLINNKASFIGDKPIMLFRKGEKSELNSDDLLTFLLNDAE
jgi:dipeptidase E